MAMSGVIPHCEIIWKLENFSCSWHQIGKSLESPVFVIDNIGESEWKLVMYPRGYSVEFKTFIGINLVQLDASRSIQKVFKITADCGILNSNNRPLCLHTTPATDMGVGGTAVKSYSWSKFIEHKELFEKKDEFLQFDVLTVCCRIWENSPHFTNNDTLHLYLRSEIPIEKQSFWWHIKDFSLFTDIPTKSICFEKLFDEDKDSVSIKLSYLVYPEGERIKATVFSKEEIDFSWKCKITVQATKNIFLLTDGVDFKGSGTQSWHLLPAITRSAIIDKNNSDEDYLLQDMLSLHCSFCVISHNIESHFTFNSKIPSVWTMELNVPKDKNNKDEKSDIRGIFINSS